MNKLLKYFSLNNINVSKYFINNLIIKDENKNFINKDEHYIKQIDFENKNYQSFMDDYYNDENFQLFEDKFNSYSLNNNFILKEQIGDYYYFDNSYYYKGKNYVRVYRYKLNEENNKTCIFDSYKDLNKNKEIQIIELIPSQNGDKLGIIIDSKNNEFYKLYIKDLNTNLMLKEKINKCYKFIFDNNDDIFYLKQNDNHRPYKLFFHKLGSSQLSDEMIYEELDEKYFLNLQLSKSKCFYFLVASSRINDKFYFIHRNNNKFKLINLDLDNNKITSLDHTKNGLIFLLNDEKVYKVSEFEEKLNLSMKIYNSTNIFSYMKPELIYEIKKDHGINEIDILNDNLILYISKAYQPLIVHINLIKKNKIKEVIIGNGYGNLSPSSNMNPNSNFIYLYHEDIFSYNNIYKYDFNQQNWELISKFSHLGKKFYQKNYKISYIEVNNLKGEKIPMTIIHHKNKKLKNPIEYSKVIVYNYGCYGINNIPHFNFNNWDLLENDYILCYVHIRGGNDLGKSWYYSALRNKSLSTEDYLTCIEYLISSGVSHPKLIFAESNSGGASILMSAVNKRPELFNGIILNSPYLDILGLSDKSISLSELDYDEFGNPEDKNDIYDIFNFCPYINIKNQEYPSILINAYENDYRTPLWSIIKFCKRFRYKTPLKIVNNEFCENNLLVKISKGSHLGKSSIDDKNKDMLFNNYFFEFLIENDKSIKIKRKISLNI